MSLAKFILFTALLCSMQVFAKTSKDLPELVIKNRDVKYNCNHAKCIKNLPGLEFSEVSDRKNELPFTAKEVSILDNDIIQFYQPRINNKPIFSLYAKCVESRVGRWGYVMCDKLKSFDVRSKLCEKLGLRYAVLKNGDGLIKYSSSRQPMYYRLNNDKDNWNLLRVGSMLLPRTSHVSLYKLSCKF
jgi:hypothetical protein